VWVQYAGEKEGMHGSWQECVHVHAWIPLSQNS
jgi:hypothetical protein